jgi:hypothetical protein
MRVATVRASLYLRAGNADDLDAAQAWLDTWRGSLLYLSTDYGCECCSSAFDVEATPEAVAAIPPSLRVNSPWTGGEGASPRVPIVAEEAFWKARKRVAEAGSARKRF